MVFSSMIFLWIFLPLVLGLYYLLKEEYRNYLLLIVSIIFYAWGEPIYIILMLLSITINYFIGILIDKKQNKRIFLVLAIIVNLSILGYFKYFFSFANGMNNVFGQELIVIKQIALPLGISFYTFQIMSYIIDLYRGEIKVQRNYFNLALYISFFPQLVAGPIVKYRDVEEQIEHRECCIGKIALGIKRFIYGLGKKVILSNSIAAVVDSIFAIPLEQLSVGWVWCGVALYTLQIYYDFSGYSDMAIGLGRMFGFEFVENFNYPYISTSIQEFWRRWHISLSTWFREYVYIPLGGNRKGKIRTYINLWIVFIVTGIWHGATLNFLLWGIWHGLFMFIERIGLGKLLEKNRFKLINHVYAMVVVMIGWAMFRCDSLAQAMETLQVMFDFKHVGSDLMWYNVASIRSCVIILVGGGLAGPLQFLFPKWRRQMYQSEKVSIIEFILQFFILGISIILLVSGQYNPFIYFKF